jgi:glycosyltransferase involved in cell wall biosynthesis
MKRVAFLLHRFPEITDTFIKREIRSLQNLGTDVSVISVWRPKADQTTPEIFAEWQKDTHFLLPASPWSILAAVVRELARSPRAFLATACLALKTARPGIKGFLYQCAYFLEAILAARELRRMQARHVHNHIGDQSGTVTMLASRLTGIGYSITYHGWPVFFDAYNARIREKVRSACFTRSISYFCRSQLMMLSGLTESRPFKVVHCGIVPGQYAYREPPPRFRTLFCAARLSPEKGQSVILEALRLARDRGYDLELELAGSGPRRDELATLARELGLGEHVHFLGSLSETEVARRLQEADAFVLSSFVEGIPVSAMEAMAAGVPVVCTNVAGTSELVEDGVTGLLVRPSSAQALADAILRLADDHALRVRLAERAREKVLREFDVAIETAKLNEHLIAACG